MISGLKPYPEMKDSGTPWLGEVPKHWEVETLRRKLRSYDGIKIGPFGSQLKLEQMVEFGFKVYGQANVIARDFSRGRKFIDQTKFLELSACEVRPGDLVVTMMGTSGRCAMVPHDAVPGIMDSHLIRLRTTSDIERTFAARVIDEAPYVKEQIEVAGKGSIMHGLNSGMIKNLLLALPPFLEQAAIVRFLDYADRRIRRYIRVKQKLIKLLEEQKQAIIHRAVTRGLDPNVRLKPSGVEWLGDVPEHWEILPNRAVMSLQKRLVGKASGEYVLLSLTKRGVIRRDLENPEGKFPTSFDTYQEVLPGDLIFCLFDIDETPRAVGLSAIHGMVTGAYTRFVCDPSVVEWVYLFYLAMDNGKRLKPLYTGLRKVITKSSFLSAKFPLPPERERTEILSEVEKVVAVSDQGVEKAQREIDLLREYRTRLIADVVTGKLDVREAAARLPDEVEEPEPLDETETEAEGDADDAGADDNDEVPEEAEA